MQLVSHLQTQSIQQVLGHDNTARGKNAVKFAAGLQQHLAVKWISRLHDFQFGQHRIPALLTANDGIKFPDAVTDNLILILKLPNRANRCQGYFVIGLDYDVGGLQGFSILEQGRMDTGGKSVEGDQGDNRKRHTQHKHNRLPAGAGDLA